MTQGPLLWTDYDPATNTFYDPVLDRRGTAEELLEARRQSQGIRLQPIYGPSGEVIKGRGALVKPGASVGGFTFPGETSIISFAEGGGEGGGTGIAVANIQAGVAALNRESEERIAALRDATDRLQLEEIKRKNDLDDAYRRDDLAERVRASKALEEIQNKRLELERAIQQWTEYYQGERLKLEEHGTRIQEAAVTGYFRPTAATPFPRVGQQIGSPGLGIQPTLAREQFQAAQATAPTVAPPTAPPATPTQAPAAQATRAPATDTSQMNIRELAELHKKQQTGPPAQTNATLAPGAQPDESRIQSEGRVVKRTVTEVFG